MDADRPARHIHRHVMRQTVPLRSRDVLNVAVFASHKPTSPDSHNFVTYDLLVGGAVYLIAGNW